MKTSGLRLFRRPWMALLLGCLVTSLASCTPVSHKQSRFKYGDPYSPDPSEPRHEKYQ